jgi:Putative RNA methylase family UPF0020/HEAT repeats
MTKKRPPGFDLDGALADPGFTPRGSDAERLLDLLLVEGPREKLAERALLRLGRAAGEAAAARVRRPAEGADDAKGASEERARLVRFIGRSLAEAIEGGEADISSTSSTSSIAPLAAALEACLDDPDARVRRAAAVALGKARPAGAGAAIMRALDAEQDASSRRALIEALGKVGGEGALAALDRAEGSAGAAREEARARLIVARTVARAAPSVVEVGRALPGPTLLALRGRRGLEELLAAGLDRALRPRLVEDALFGSRVEVTLSGPLARVFESRTMLSFGLPLPPARLEGRPLAEAIAASLTSPAAIALLAHFTTGPLRYRLAWASGGKRRALVWQVAEEVSRRAPTAQPLVNDPTESPWEACIYEGEDAVRIELRPNVPDPRFTYRSADVSGASHPTIAAALAQVGGAQPDDVVWDPFVGSGTELCERAAIGPFSRMFGSDLSPAALGAAAQNLAAAGVPKEHVELLRGDALELARVVRPSLILTNPPLGRRVLRSADLAPMLEAFVEEAARALTEGGRMVWFSPFPDRSEAVARRCGLTLTSARDVDMGGFDARMQAFRRPGRGGAR